MRTKRINLYPFNELSEEAKRKALEGVVLALPNWLSTCKNTNAIIEAIESNSYEFLKDGTLFNLT